MARHFPLGSRYFACAAFVLSWMLIHFELKLSPLVGQCVGLPLVLGFQLFVARRPIWKLWAFDSPDFHLRRPFLILAVVLLVFACILVSLASGSVLASTNQRLGLCALVAFGVWPTAYALQEQSQSNLRRALPWIIAVILFGVIWRVGWTVASVLSAPPGFPFRAWRIC